MGVSRLFLEGPKEYGKTTLLLREMKELSDVAGGFVVRRLVDGEGGRRGFCITAPRFSDQAAIPFGSDAPNIFMERTGSRTVRREQVLEDAALGLLSDFERRSLMVLDEFGGSELLSPIFRARLMEVLHGSVPCVGVFKSRENAMSMMNTLELPAEYIRRYGELRAYLLEDPRVNLLAVDSLSHREVADILSVFLHPLRESLVGVPSETLR